MNLEQQMFWMVLGAGVPVYKHATFDTAQAEAARLARLNPAEPFYVLQSVAVVYKSDVFIREYSIPENGRLSDEIPF